jgi:tRNA pseudouridine(38-40) synthase
VTRVRWLVDDGAEAADANAGKHDANENDQKNDKGSGRGRLLRFEITASSFCHQMVRSLVASLVDVGRGKSNAATLLEQLRAGTRERQPEPAPPQGLCLVRVDYG